MPKREEERRSIYYINSEANLHFILVAWSVLILWPREENVGQTPIDVDEQRRWGYLGGA